MNKNSYLNTLPDFVISLCLRAFAAIKRYKILSRSHQGTKVHYILILVFFTAFQAYGQSVDTTSCAQNLLDAQALFAAGKLNQVPAKIEGCLREGFTKPEKVQAYKLLSVTYTYLEEYDKADEAVLNLLKLEKEYRVNPEIDPTEFIKLYQKFRTYPIFQVGLKLGINNPWMIIGHTYETSSEPGANAGVYTMKNGLNAGIEFEIPLRSLSENFEICPSLNFSQKSIDILDSMTTSYSSASFGSIGSFQGTESQTWIELPVLARYIFHYHGLKPFVELGPSFNYLLNAQIKNPFASSNGSPPKSNNFSIMTIRNQYNYAVQIGAGMKFDIPMAEVVIKANFNYALNQLNVRNIPPSDPENIFANFGYRDPDFRLNYFSLTIGYIYKVYKPKKIFE